MWPPSIHQLRGPIRSAGPDFTAGAQAGTQEACSNLWLFEASESKYQSPLVASSPSATSLLPATSHPLMTSFSLVSGLSPLTSHPATRHLGKLTAVSIAG